MITDQEFVELQLAVENNRAVPYLEWLNCKYLKELGNNTYSVTYSACLIELLMKLGMKVSIIKENKDYAPL